METIMKSITKKLRSFVREEDGLTTVEYAVAGGLIALAVVGAFQALGVSVGGVITGIDTAISGG
jgi:pilus assembly protein Flp/PilA